MIRLAIESPLLGIQPNRCTYTFTHIRALHLADLVTELNGNKLDPSSDPSTARIKGIN